MTRSIVRVCESREDAEARADARIRAGHTGVVVWREIGDWTPLGKDAAR